MYRREYHKGNLLTRRVRKLFRNLSTDRCAVDYERFYKVKLKANMSPLGGLEWQLVMQLVHEAHKSYKSELVAGGDKKFVSWQVFATNLLKVEPNVCHTLKMTPIELLRR